MNAREWRERWERAERELERHAGTVDRLNVFPVADRDTGHNMLATLHAGVARLTGAPASPQASARALVEGAVRMARGNSGVILSQWLRGFAEAAPDADEWTEDHFRAALRAGARFAREHVAEPVEGTILTVADAAAAGASHPAASGGHFWASVLEAAGQALSSTPEALPALRAAGVVDAGGQGLVLVLEGFAGADSGSPAVSARPGGTAVSGPRQAPSALPYPYDIEALVVGLDVDAALVHEGLTALGDSIVLSALDPRELKVHVHTDQPHQVVRLLEDAGRIRELTLLDMRDQVETGDGGPWPVVDDIWQDLYRAAGFAPLAPSEDADRPGALWLAPDRMLRDGVAVSSPGALLVALDHWWEAGDVKAEARVLERAEAVREFKVERIRGGGIYRVDPPGIEGSLETVVKTVAGEAEGAELVHCYVRAEATEEEVRLWEDALAAEARRVVRLPVWALIVRE